MPRNIEKDAKEEIQRRENLLKAGLKMCSENGIENVTLQEIANEAGTGIATLYNYYGSKVNLVNAISAYMWKSVWEKNSATVGADVLDSYNAYQGVEAYFDLMIYLYKTHPEILRFSSFYKTYMNQINGDKTGKNEHLEVVAPIETIFHNLYEKAQIDKSIRTDINEHTMFTTLALTMLGMAERYAQGLVWASNDDNDYTRELMLLKDMMLSWIRG